MPSVFVGLHFSSVCREKGGHCAMPPPPLFFDFRCLQKKNKCCKVTEMDQTFLMAFVAYARLLPLKFLAAPLLDFFKHKPLFNLEMFCNVSKLLQPIFCDCIGILPTIFAQVPRTIIPRQTCRPVFKRKVINFADCFDVHLW